MTSPPLGAAEIRAAAERLGVRPTKTLGQNFLHDANTIRRIAPTAALEPSETVLEVGPGLGSLTLGLLDAGHHVTAAEIDPVLAGALPARVLARLPLSALTVVRGDALRVPVPSAPTALVANGTPQPGRRPWQRQCLGCPMSGRVGLSTRFYRRPICRGVHWELPRQGVCMPDLNAVLPIDAFGVAETPTWWAVAALAVAWLVELAVFSRWLQGQLNVRHVPAHYRGCRGAICPVLIEAIVTPLRAAPLAQARPPASRNGNAEQEAAASPSTGSSWSGELPVRRVVSRADIEVAGTRVARVSGP